MSRALALAAACKSGGFNTLLISGGMPVPHLDTSVVDFLQLPPILVVQPGEDKNVPLEMTYDLISKYQSAGGYVEYVFYPGEEHGFAHLPSVVSDSCIELITSFVKRHST